MFCRSNPCYFLSVFMWSSEEVEQILSQGEYLRVTGLMHEMLSHICDQAHDRCLKVLVARSRVRLTLPGFIVINASSVIVVDYLQYSDEQHRIL